MRFLFSIHSSSYHDSHWMSIALEPFEEINHFLMDWHFLNPNSVTEGLLQDLNNKLTQSFRI